MQAYEAPHFLKKIPHATYTKPMINKFEAYMVDEFELDNDFIHAVVDFDYIELTSIQSLIIAEVFNVISILTWRLIGKDLTTYLAIFIGLHMKMGLLRIGVRN
jgi:hypothetical protein